MTSTQRLYDATVALAAAASVHAAIDPNVPNHLREKAIEYDAALAESFSLNMGYPAIPYALTVLGEMTADAMDRIAGVSS